MKSIKYQIINVVLESHLLKRNRKYNEVSILSNDSING